MGNSLTKDSWLNEPYFYLEKFKRTAPGDIIYRCSFEKWISGAYYVCGFGDSADYETARDDFRGKGVLLRPDVTDGRYLKVHKICSTKILIEEKMTHQVYTVYIPACQTSGKIPQRWRLDHRTLVVSYIQQQTSKDGMAVIACHQNLAVVQVLDRRECYVPEFYFIDLETQTSIGKFHTKDSELFWYECYISPDKRRVILRPDINACGWTASDTVRKHRLNRLEVITMRRFADSGGHALCFDNRHGNRFLVRAKEKDVQMFDLEVMDVWQSKKNLALPAPIRQVKSSPSGDYLAVRCVYPAFSMEFQTNVIAVLNATTLDLLFQIDAKGSYWPTTEAVNLQVFPVFSSCDSAIAVMKHGATRRRVSLYKLPVACTTLQHCCRKLLRKLVLVHHLNQLPLPLKLIQFLRYQL